MYMQVTFLNNNPKYQTSKESLPKTASELPQHTNFSPSFKGQKPSIIVSKIIDLAEKFKKFFTKKQPAATEKEAVHTSIKEPLREISEKVKELPFDARARLKKLGVDDSIAEAFIEACGTNKEHFAKLVSMYKAGFEPQQIPTIFAHAKKDGERLATSFYVAAYNIKDKVPHKYIPTILDNFRQGTIKFDYAGFSDFQNLKAGAHKLSPREHAFRFMLTQDIDDYFYHNIDDIKKTANFFGKENFMELYNLDFDKMNTVIAQTPILMRQPKSNRKLIAALEEKIKQSSSDRESFESKTDTLIRLFELFPAISENSKRNTSQRAEVISLINNL